MACSENLMYFKYCDRALPGKYTLPTLTCFKRQQTQHAVIVYGILSSSISLAEEKYGYTRYLLKELF